MQCAVKIQRRRLRNTRDRVGLRKNHKSGELNGLFNGTEMREVLKGKDYKNVENVFPFLTAFIIQAKECTK